MLELVKSNSQILHNPCKKFDFRNPQIYIANFGKALVQMMYDKNCLGLAAPQVGYPYQVFAMRGSPENYVVINPKIVEHSETQEYLEEGCASYPGLIIKVKRYTWISARFSGPNGTTKTHRFEGLSSKVFQHEADHLYGTTFFDRCGLLQKEQAIKKWNKLCKI